MASFERGGRGGGTNQFVECVFVVSITSLRNNSQGQSINAFSLKVICKIENYH